MNKPKKFQCSFFPESPELEEECRKVMEKHGLSWNKFLNHAAKLAVQDLKKKQPVV